MFKASCHCGEIKIKSQKTPDSITSCNCSLCNKIGALWAYFTKEDVIIKAPTPTNEYQWGKKRRTYHTCKKCGCTTHYTQLRDDGTNRVAVNSRMVDPNFIQSVPIKYFDGANTFKYIS
ncbi:GFA family protein [Catenovulum adriaticum]|uniref:Aldehyde-activating protein n=1 Tax=Catenovulum adriaticum TaxID=2984846 RepID=A0ABY7AST0_9ALTE|nr:aldehyde-activating protein [Catenovulum sp. TS8]WAJ72375.1 aldehyde-activating protein [Catenovulum sp. TS8]